MSVIARTRGVRRKKEPKASLAKYGKERVCIWAIRRSGKRIFGNPERGNGLKGTDS